MQKFSKKKCWLLLCIPFFWSCRQDIPEPTGFDSTVNIEGLNIMGLVSGDSIVGTALLKFTIPGDTSVTPDTVKIVQTYYINQQNADQKFYFNTPANALQAYFDFSVRIYGGSASGVRFSNFSYTKSGQSLISKPLDLEGVQDYFFAPTQTTGF